MLSYLSDNTSHNKCESCLHSAKKCNSIFVTSAFARGECFHFRVLKSSEILLLHKGKLKVTYANTGITQVINEGEMILLTDKTTVNFNALDDGIALLMKFDNYDVICKVTLLDEAPSYANNACFLKPSQLNVDNSLKNLSEVLISLINRDIDCLYYQRLIREIFFFLLEMFYTKEQVINFFYPILTQGFKFKNFIYNSYQQAPTVKELIELSKMSRTAFYKTFREEFGLSAKKWLVQKKMSFISTGFRDESLTIKEIMFAAGFDNHSQFTRFCKTNFGDIPSNLIRRFRA